MKITRKMTDACIWLLVLVGCLGTATTLRAAAVTYTFTATGSGTIGTTGFTNALVTITAIGDTSTVAEAPQPTFPPNVFFNAPPQFNVSISGVGTATFTGTNSFFGGHGYVFDNENSSFAGFGVESDHGDISNSAFATYDLRSSIGPLSGVSMSFSNEATSLGSLSLTTVTDGTFTAVVSSAPEPATAGMAALALAVAALIRRKRTPV